MSVDLAIALTVGVPLLLVVILWAARPQRVIRHDAEDAPPAEDVRPTEHARPQPSPEARASASMPLFADDAAAKANRNQRRQKPWWRNLPEGVLMLGQIVAGILAMLYAIVRLEPVRMDERD